MNDLVNNFPKTYNNLTVEYQNEVAVLIFNMANEKINKLSTAVLYEFADALEILFARKGLKVLVIKSGKKNIFIAGADIEEIENLQSPLEAKELVEKGQQIVTRLRSAPFKSIAVIDGACMGGGLELALSCTFRIASSNSKTKIGLPEVNLGIFPGFGGTQMLPSLVGLTSALDLILTGRAVDAKKAFKIGLVDDVYPPEYENQVLNSWIEKILQGEYLGIYKRRNKNRPFISKIPFIGKKLIFGAARKSIFLKTKGNFPAPASALGVIEKTYGKPLHEGLKIELKTFLPLVTGEISKNLIQIFYTTEELKKEYADVSSDSIKNIFLLGAGVMGGGIAWLFSYKNIPVRIKDISLEGIKLGYKHIAEIYSSLLKKRKIKETDLVKKYSNITATVNYSGLNHADLILEAIVEDLPIKQKTLNEVEALAKPSAVIATNTSSLLIKDIGANLKRPENLVGMHFFNPVNKMPLVEVVKSEKSSEASVAFVVNLARKIGKIPIVVGDSAGFVVNRLLLAFMNEALFCLEETGDILTIEKCMTNFGMPMGPFLLADEVGLDVAYKVCKNLHTFYGERMKPSYILDFIYHEKKLLGKKSGLGFYIHNKKTPALNKVISDELTAKSSRKPLAETEILERCLYIMVNEAARVLEEKMIKNASQLDLALIMGTGFPPFRGGLLKYADKIGSAKIVSKLEQFSVQYNARFSPCFFLQSLAKENITFYLK